jgi:23S rRNA pseudouridine2605 synthase
LTLDGHRVFVEDVSYIEGEAKSEIGLKLRSANVKVVRSIFEHFSYDVLRIDRVSFAGLTKKTYQEETGDCLRIKKSSI